MNKALVSLSVMFAALSSLNAQQEATFSAPGLDGAWNDADNWTTGNFPNNGGTTYDVILPDTSVINGLGGNITVDSVTTGGSVTFENVSAQVLTITDSLSHTSGNYTIGDDAGLVLGTASVSQIEGTLTMKSGAGLLNQGSLIIGNGPQPTLGFTPDTSSFTSGYVLRNEGALRVDSGASVSVEGGGELNVYNHGLFVIAGGVGGTVGFDSFTQNESGSHNVTRVVEDSTLTADTVTITRGHLFINGTLDAETFSFGTGTSGAIISGGEGFDGVGTMTLEGEAGILGGSTWAFDLTGATTFDKILIEDSLSLTSIKLSVALHDEFTPNYSDSFAIITSSTSVSGTFANLDGMRIGVEGGTGTFEVDINEAAKTVYLTHYSAVPEPSSYAVILGVSAMFCVGRRRARGGRNGVAA